MADGLGGRLTSAQEALAEHSSGRRATADTTESSPQASQEKIKRVIERLTPRTDESDRQAIEKFAAEGLRTREAARFDSLIIEMQTRVQMANQTARARDADAARAAELIASIRALDGNDIDRLRNELCAVERRKRRLAPDIFDRLSRAERAARAHADQSYAAEVIREEFERLGYDVQEGFETLFVSGGAVDVRKPGMKEYPQG